ncbi:HAMP domain-containing histidine kinase [Vibrio sp. JC009]|uniref:HAMP domain-containing sensor histidine kinase n=1 Tax=Vibrio sp. JC009 TaxID=2912314 RepID=UPI0023B116AA|nr:HAMP domain-containing sensor histidine kinase [Vibrio sp. JC009]WED23618.1 HAMP domain-containing histidine kinase [Vibrio sp. JC009]
MRFSLLDRTHSMTGRLALFFTAASVIIGLAVYAIFYVAIMWSEDRVGERRILLDRDLAIVQYELGQTGALRIDSLTVSYDDIRYIPEKFRDMVDGKTDYLGETGTKPNERMLYVGEHTIRGAVKTIYLISDIDTVEFSDEEFATALSVALTVIALLLLAFGLLLYRLSQRLISPINSLSEQLEANAGDTESPFVLNPSAALEFRQLANQLNRYRDEINGLLKREQAFARYASHELRTPLTIIRGANKLLQNKNQASENGQNSFQGRQLQRIDDASKQMTAMVDALLSLVRYEKQGEESETRAFSKKELCAIVDNNTLHTLDKSIPLEVTVEGEPLVVATPAIMNMVVGNLVRNAIAATSQGKIEIIMHSESLTVLDNGVGLQPDSGTPDNVSHGLGLLIVEEFCQRYQWQFSLTNRQRGGCMAKIIFRAF